MTNTAAPSSPDASNPTGYTLPHDQDPSAFIRAPRFGFLAQVNHSDISYVNGKPASAGLNTGVELFSRAQQLGYDVGYVRTRHLQDALSSPLLFLAAIGQIVPRMELGTAVIPVRFENAGRLAEDLASCDLLLGGRLRAGLGPGYTDKDAIYVPAFGSTNEDLRSHTDRVISQVISFIEGDIVATADSHIEGVAPGAALRVQPHVQGLRSRLSYGAASAERAAWVGAQGLRLQLATLTPDDGSERSFADLQCEVIRAYRAASEEHGHGRGFVSVSRQMVPVADEADLEKYVSLIPRERAGEAGVTSEYRGLEIGGAPAVFSEVVIDTPDAVSEALIADAAVREADELVLTLPFSARHHEQVEVLTVFGEEVLPALVTALV